MILKEALLSYLLEQLNQAGHNVKSINRVTPVSGGSINQAFKLESSQASYFVKMNKAGRYPGMFEAEARGLKLLRDKGTIRTPGVIGTGSYDDHDFLLLEFIDTGGGEPDSYRELGFRLASQHRQTNSSFGLDHDNYIGSLEQRNTRESGWTEFFGVHRLEAQLRMAHQYFDAGDRRSFERLISRLDELIPIEPPALLHGDLWSGNYLIDSAGAPVFIDPAVYYGHREVDISMMQLFGGFPPEVMHAYEENYPLENGWKSRVDLHNLYPLLVHVNLFGLSYVSQVKSILKHFT